MPLHPASIIIGTTIAVIGSGYAFKKFIYDPHLAPYVEYWIAQRSSHPQSHSPHARRRTTSGLQEGVKVGIPIGITSARGEGVREGLRRRGQGGRSAGSEGRAEGGDYELRAGLLAGYEDGMILDHNGEGEDSVDRTGFKEGVEDDRGRGRGEGSTDMHLEGSKGVTNEDAHLDTPLIDLDSSYADIRTISSLSPVNPFNHNAEGILSVIFDVSPSTPTPTSQTPTTTSRMSFNQTQPISPTPTLSQAISPDYTHIDIPNLDDFATPFRQAEVEDHVLVSHNSPVTHPFGVYDDVLSISGTNTTEYMDMEEWDGPEVVGMSYSRGREDSIGGGDLGSVRGSGVGSGSGSGSGSGIDSGSESRMRSRGSVISLSSDDEDWRSDFGMSDGEGI